ncbi:MAG: hypothetical protein WC329_01335 [Candidatus Omnitrophota bacterium]|jgi:quercetin dioxygenase-like cupin family protein
MLSVLEGIPYQAVGMGERKLVDEKHLPVMRIALRAGESVPRHNADSNVHLLVLSGEVTVSIDNGGHMLKQGYFLPVAFKSSMSIKNIGEKEATFLVIKTPNPGEMQK